MITTQFPGVLTRPVWGWEAGSEAVDQDRTRGRSARSFPVRYDLSWGSGERMTTRRASRISDQRSLSPTRAFFLSTSDHQEHHFNDTMIHARHQNICHPFPWNLGGKKHHQMHCWSNLKNGKEWKARYFSSFVKNAPPPPCILLKNLPCSAVLLQHHHHHQFYCNNGKGNHV